jgi:hypothetical protein
MKASIPAIVLLFAILCSCDRSVDNHEWIVEKMYTTEAELPQTGSVGEPIVFTAISRFGDSCWEFSHFKTSRSGYDIYVTPYAKRLAKEIICAAVMTTVSGEGKFTPNIQGEYTFHFWRSDTISLDYTVTVE